MARQESGMATAGDGAVHGRPALLAGVLMMGANLMDVVAAYPNTRTDSFVILTRSAIHQVDITGWVWLHVGVGMAAAIAGLAIIVNQRWAPLGIAAAALAVAMGILIFPFAPIRDALVLVANAAAIRLLVRDRRRRRTPPPG
ncbi:MAG TPA: hypothetical protein VF462_17520 [Micromonosporaceae bacterium]